MATADKLTYLNETKNEIRKAIEEENLVTIDDTTTFREYADKIKSTNEEIKKYIPTDSKNGTSLQVTNAVPLNLKKGVIDGNSYQYTTKGNQLFDFANARAVGGGVTWNFDNDVLSVSSIAGTTGYKSIQIDITDLCKENKGKSLKFTDNGYSVEDISLNPMVQITVKYSDGTSNFYRSLRNYRHNTSDKYTIPEDMTNISSVICGIYSNNTSNAVANNLIIEKPLLYFDDNNEYEQYTGGKASPSPDYPQEIEVVSGKNLIGLGNLVNGYVDITQGGRWLNTTSGKTYIFETSNLPDKVTISGDGNRANVSYFNTMPEQYQIADSFTTTNYKYLPRTFEVNKNYKYIFIQVAYEMYNTELHMQLEKGDIATEILPFNNLLLTNSGKNICPTDYEKYWEKGQYSTQGVKEEKASRCRLKELLRIKPNTDYYCSCYLTDNSNYRFAIRELDKNKNFVSNKGLIVNRSTYTSSSNAYYIAVTITYIDSETEQNYEPLFADGTIQPLICLSSYEDKTFEPYRETDKYLIDLKDNFLAKIGDVKDTLDLTNGILSKNIKKVVLDGVNNKSGGRVNTYNNGSYQFIFNFENSYKTSNNNEKAKIICDKLIAITRNETHGAPQLGGKSFEGIAPSGLTNTYYGNGCVIYRDKWASYTTAQVNEDLQNDPLTLYYQVAETETIQLDPINIKMYEGTNNIELDTNLETNMSLEYYKDYTLDSQEVEVSGVTE